LDCVLALKRTQSLIRSQRSTIQLNHSIVPRFQRDNDLRSDGRIPRIVDSDQLQSGHRSRLVAEYVDAQFRRSPGGCA
jgi:hypothetical protein